ncbi:wee1-like protein kinase 1-A [Pecten maximus]|uniref:wee1-like protein kinase 1-A n=1 Tax=Pecten maximus TaxID=6579 RepID=UPI0014585601|nr:wee1-like protein kinase 1-A [Pecten maximus]
MLAKGRRSALKRRDENIIRTLTYHDSDEGELSPSDGDFVRCGNLFSPCRFKSDRNDDQPSEFIEIDLPSSPMSSPRSSRNVIRHMKRSPIQFTLDEGNEGDVDDDEQRVPAPGTTIESPCPNSPPHNRLRALRLFDTPHTPKSLLQKARRRRLTDERIAKEKKRLTPPSENRVEANFNPFTPNNNRPQTVNTSMKRNRNQMERSILDDSTEDEIEVDMPSTKKIALHEINTSRYNEEFHEVCKLGDGEFGSVYKCVHRLDGCTYAIKKSKMPVAGSVYERNAMNEVYAHAVLGKHQHVVRYYSAWAEEDHMYIQNEYCNGGSLAEVVDEDKRTGRVMSEAELKTIMYQSVLGLKYIHSQNLVHLDIKPGNIFIHRNPKFLQSPESGMESCGEEEEEEEAAIIYKIGDLGHVTSVTNPTVEDGDCHYLPKEILSENFDHLSKCDVFSLGLTMYEAGGGHNLPRNGPQWHKIREGQLPCLPHLSAELNQLLKSMVDPDPVKRPSAAAVASSPILCPQSTKSRAQLRRELNEERFKNQMLSRKLVEATQCLTRITPASFSANVTRKSRLIGNKMKRSMSLSAF